MTLSLLCQIIFPGFYIQHMVVIGSLKHEQSLTLLKWRLANSDHGSHLIYTPAIVNEVALMYSHGYLCDLYDFSWTTATEFGDFYQDSLWWFEIKWLTKGGELLGGVPLSEEVCYCWSQTLRFHICSSYAQGDKTLTVSQDAELWNTSSARCLPAYCLVFHHDDNKLNPWKYKPFQVNVFLYKNCCGHGIYSHNGDPN